MINDSYQKFCQVLKIGLIFFMGFMSLACSTSGLLRDKDYEYSKNALNSEASASELPENIKVAIESLPKNKEKNGFITTLESAYLKLWSQNTESNSAESHLTRKELQEIADSLLRQSKSFEARKYTSITKETKTFFFQESEDGYIPSEPEVIAHHLVTSMYLIKLSQLESARVELKKANEFFLAFDSSSLRLWSAAMWIQLNEWNEAQVDLRKAIELEPRLAGKYEKYLAMDEAQKNQLTKNGGLKFTLSFYGFGPEVQFQGENFDADFVFNETRLNSNRKTLDGQVANKIPTLSLNVGASDLAQGQLHSSSKDDLESVRLVTTQDWYVRHKQRNTEFREFVTRSNYMAQYLTVKTKGGVVKTLGAAGAGAVAIGGAVVGGALIVGGLYLLSAGITSGADVGQLVGWLFIVGWGVTKSAWETSSNFYDKVQNDVKEDEVRSLNESRNYRFVRFLPSSISLDIN